MSQRLLPCPPEHRPSSAGEGWRDLHDPARGARRVRLDAQGRAREVRLADGQKLAFSHDELGRLRQVEGSGGFFLRIDPPGLGAPALRVEDPAGETEVSFDTGGTGGQTLRRRGAGFPGVAALRFEHDGQGRLVRAVLPGSEQALVYRFHEDGSCDVGPAGGLPALTAVVGEGVQSFRLHDGWGWDESVVPGRFRTAACAADGAERLGVELSLDLQGRTLARRWTDGLAETFERDGAGRLAQIAVGSEVREYRYEAGELVADAGPEGTWEREIGPGGRVAALLRPDGSRVRYEYDAAGRRTLREAPEGVTHYGYDLLGQLVRVERGGARVDLSYDGLGRRVAVAADGAPLRQEHRDAAGRLWAVTDGEGRALWTFFWWGDRLIARLDGPVGEPVAEAYLCDPGGTPLAVLRGAPGERAAERLEPGPFGKVGEERRPALYGHVGDPETGLIPFGARDLDPELGVFLTPDPWHGGEDDPRRWAGWSARALSRLAELPAAGIHPYALCQFDPLGRVDSDGHFAGGWFFLHVLLTPTWGQALTSVSLFFFLPLNLYVEILIDVIYLFVSLFRWDLGRVPWRNYHVWKMIGVAGSGRQGIFAFGLNGLLPRLVSSHMELSANRAVTVGSVVWINSEELGLLERPRVLELWDLAGPPGAGGAPTGGATRFNADPGRLSALAVEGHHKDGKKRLLAAYWSRGYGNTVDVVGTNLTFQDRPNPPGGAEALSAVHLAKPLPFGFPHPGNDEGEKLEVKEFLHVLPGPPGSGIVPDLEAEAELATSPWFAFDAAKDRFNRGDVLEIAAPKASPAVAATYRIVAAVINLAERAVVIFDHALPARFVTANLHEDLTLQRVNDRPGPVPGWAIGATADQIELAAPAPPPAAGWPPVLGKGDVVKLHAATAAGAAPPALPAGIPAPLPNDTAYARVQAVRSTLRLTPALGALALNGLDLFLLRAEGAWFRATVPDPAGKPAEIKLGANPPDVQAGHLVSIKLEAAPGRTTTARVASVVGDVVTLDPAFVPALNPVAANAVVLVQRFVESDRGRDKGTVTSQTGDEVQVEVESTTLFPAGRLVRFEIGGTPHVRRIDAVTKVALTLSDEVRGTGAVDLTPARVDTEMCPDKTKRATLTRLLRRVNGAQPSAFGQYPAKLMTVSYAPRIFGVLSEFFVRNDPAVRGTFHPDYKLFWTPQVIDGAEYWVLEADLPIDEKEIQGTTEKIWRYDPDNPTEFIRLGAPPLRNLVVREFTASGVTRVDGGGKRVRAYQPEALVPVRPQVHDTHRRSLIEHELHHAVQNNFYGPIMGAFPLQGILMTVADMITAGGGEIPDWLSEPPLDEQGNPPPNFPDHIDNNTELNWPQVFSIGGIMQLAWKYVFLWPALISPEARKEIHVRDFSFWSKIFNPFWGFVTSRIPEVDPNAPADERWGIALAKLVERAMDLRSWTPFLGFVPLMLPDGPRSFLEQGASRASGDLYSTILTANDKFNFKTGTKANLRPKLGEAVRLMIYAAHRADRLILQHHGDVPGSLLTYGDTVNDTEPVTISLAAAFPAGTHALFPPDLYEVIAGSGPSTVHNVEGPPPAAGGGARPQTAFIRVAAGAATQLRPRLRSLVPLPPRVSRSAGFYFFPAAPGAYAFEAHWAGAPAEAVANTHKVTLTAETTVRLGEEDIPWAEPAAVGAAPPGPPIQRFLTETADLKVPAHRIDEWVLDIDRADVATKTDLPDRSGWKVTMKHALPAAAAGPQARVRLYRLIKKNDPSFNLHYENGPDRYKVASLRGVRSYLQDDLWLPVRDFLLEIRDLPVLPPAATNYHEAFHLDLDVPVSGAGAITFVKGGVASPLPLQRIGKPPGAAHPRGERWDIGPLQQPPEDPEVYTVTVKFGTAPNLVPRPFQLTVNPLIRLENATAGAPFEARQGTPLVLDVNGGANPERVEHPGLPAGTTVTRQGRQVTVTVATPPAADTNVVITVIDADDRRGRRTVKIKH